MVKLARNEQCITSYPLTARYSIGPFPARVTFLPSEGSFPAFGYLRPVTGLFCLWAKFSPWIQLARLWPVNLLGHFHSIIKYGLLTTARYGWRMNGRFQLYPIYGHNVVCYWPMFGQPVIRPVEGPLMIWPIEGPLCLCPVEGPLFLRPLEGPLFLRPVGAHVNYSKYVAHC